VQQLILQASEPNHFEKTIRKPLTLLDVEEWLTDKEKGELDQIYGNNRMHIWGVRPGKNNVNRTRWQKAHPGDVVCFIQSKIVIFWAAITYKTLNPILSEQLWERDNSNQTWEYMYFMKNGVFHGLPLEQVNVLLDYEPEFYPQGYQKGKMRLPPTLRGNGRIKSTGTASTNTLGGSSVFHASAQEVPSIHAGEGCLSQSCLVLVRPPSPRMDSAATGVPPRWFCLLS